MSLTRSCLDCTGILLFCVSVFVFLYPLDVYAAEERPNLIIILADDIGIEAFGSYGGESYETPHIDQLASEGVLLENAYTQPLCTPTRIELLTGRSNARNYRSFSVLDPSERTFANELQDAGYRTFVVGKWQLYGAEQFEDNVRAKGSLPGQAGFDHHALWQVESVGSRYWEPRMTIDGVTETFEPDRYGPDIALEHAKNWITESRNEPFLLFWPMLLPHSPFIAPPGIDEPRKTTSNASMFAPLIKYIDSQVGSLVAFLRELIAPRNATSNASAYAPLVKYMDSQVGSLVAFLRELDLDRDTVVMFIGDNGSPRDMLSQRNGRTVQGGKETTWETGSHVPFVIWAPGYLEGGHRLQDIVSTVDVFATLLELAGVELPSNRKFDGWSLWQRLKGKRDTHRDWVTFHHHPWPLGKPESEAKRWARDERWQLFENGQLFNVRDDPKLKRELKREGASQDAVAARRKLEAALETLPRR